MSPMGGPAINVGGIVADLELNSGNLERGLARARQALDAAHAEIKRLQDDLKAGAISANDAAARIAVLNTTVNDLTTRMQAAYAAVGTTNGGLNLLRGTAGRTTAQVQGLSNALLALGRGGQDYAQAGFMGIVNNFEQLGLALGQLAKMSPAQASMVAAGLQTVATAAFVLWKNWDSLMDYFDVGIPVPATDGLSDLEHRLKRLNEEIHNLTKDQKRITIVEQRIIREKVAERDATQRKIDEDKELKRIMGGQTHEESETASAFGEAARAAGPGEMALEQLQEAIRQQADANGQIFNPFAGEMTTPAQYAKDLMRMAGIEGNKDAYRVAMEFLSESFGGPGGSSFGQQLFDNDPAVKKGRQEMDEALRKIDEERKRTENAPDDRFEKRARDVDQANRLATEEAKNEAKANAGTDLLTELANKQDRENRARVNRMVHDAEEQAPGLKERVEQARLRERYEEATGGPKVGGVLDQIKAAMKERGYSDDDAAKIAANLVNDADQSIGTKAARGQGRPETPRHSEVFNASDLNHRIQAAVGGENYGKRQVDLQTQMLDTLNKIEQKPAGFAFKPGQK